MNDCGLIHREPSVQTRWAIYQRRKIVTQGPFRVSLDQPMHLSCAEHATILRSHRQLWMSEEYTGFLLFDSSGLIPNWSGLMGVRAFMAFGIMNTVFRTTCSTGESATARQHRLHTADDGQQNGDSSSHGSHSGILSHESRRLLRHVSLYRKCPSVRVSRICPLNLPSLKHGFCGQHYRKSRKYRSRGGRMRKSVNTRSWLVCGECPYVSGLAVGTEEPTSLVKVQRSEHDENLAGTPRSLRTQVHGTLKFVLESRRKLLIRRNSDHRMISANQFLIQLAVPSRYSCSPNQSYP